jgi:hypothetical protein
MFFHRRPSQIERRPNRIEFLCRPEDKGVIAEPQPAKTYLPDWFRKIPAVDKAHLTPTNTGLTVKRCMPFFDALATGWILRWPPRCDWRLGTTGGPSKPVGN